MHERLNGIVLPQELGIARDHVAPKKERPEGYDAGYDFLTLAYDAFYLSEAGRIRMVCPKLLNFEELVRNAHIGLDGFPLKVRRIKKYERYDDVELDAESPGCISLAVEGCSAEMEAKAPDLETFAGRNVLVTVSRNNELEWIRDWVRYNVRIHGADALLLYDNGSDLYEAEVIVDMLSEEKSLRALKVISADFPYGPLGTGRSKFDGNFLQAALLNIAKSKYLSTARAALQSDVDELVVPNGRRTIFDAAVAARTGYLKFPGRWMYPDTPEGVAARHRDHVLTGDPPRTCPAKYCIVPDGRLRNHVWATHRVRGLPLGWRFLSREFSFLHCRGISDFWKGRPRPLELGQGQLDPDAEAILARAFD